MQEPQATVAGPGAPAKRKGRPPGSKRKSTDRELIEQLAREVDLLRRERDSDRIDQSKATLPPEVAKVPPGTILAAGKDPLGQPVLFKRRWSKAELDEAIPKVTFTPNYSAPVTVFGHTVEFIGGQEITVWRSHKDVYERSMRVQHPDMAALYRAPNPTQVYEQNEAARRQPGVRVFSGLHHLGVGLNVQTPETGAEESQ